VPSKESVGEAVLAFLAGFTGLAPGAIQMSWDLRGPPLRFDDNRLAYLAMALRGYVKSFNGEETVTAGEVRKSGLTVDGLRDLIYGKVA
jgi:hypothetical protein